MKKLFVILTVLVLSSVLFSQQFSPAVFYSDLTSGPNLGGQDNAGAFVTVHGKGFGSVQGSSFVTIGGGKAASYQLWSDSTITFQLGAEAASGSIVVTVEGLASNGVPFTVRSGNIYFVAANGSNSNRGSYDEPWQTVAYAVRSIQSGDIVYLRNSPDPSSYMLASMVSASLANPQDTSGSALVISRSGSATEPMALAAYPNSSVAIGSSVSLANGIYLSGSNWTLSGFILRGGNTALVMSNVSGIRIAGNDVSCPNGSGTAGCIAAVDGSTISILGNYVHDTGQAASTAPEYYQAMYLLSTNGVEIGWNTIENTRGCNAISARSTSAKQHSLSIHDNSIQNTRCTAIELGSVDPSLGEVALYNNIIVNSGVGPAFGGSSTEYGYSAIHVSGTSTTPVQAYNNTIYNAGLIGSPEAGAVRASGAVNLTNNIVYLLSGEQYIAADTSLSWVAGSNNLFFGAGAPLGTFADSVASDPMFVSLPQDFHLLPGSPAIGSGAAMQPESDFDGVLRSATGYDIGAYEHVSPLITTSASSDFVISNHTRVPVANFSPTSLTFASQAVGTTSAAQTITLTNAGRAALSIIGIAASGDFAQTNLCGSSLAINASCTISVTFNPTATGTRSGAIAFTDNAEASPQRVVLSGTASTAATLQSASSALAFGSITAGTSTLQTVVISNTGNASATIQTITTGNTAFTVSGATLPAAIAAGRSLTLTVNFAPTAAGSFTGTLAIQSNATNSTLSVALSGAAVAATPVIGFSSTSLTFASQTLGSSSAAQSITLTNTGTAALSISGIAASGDFSQTNLCSSSLAVNASCTISVTFTPTATGARSGAISFSDNAAASPQQVSLSGTGSAATLQAASSALAFGSITAGTSTLQTVVISNTGNASATIQTITTGNTAFTVSGATLPAAIAAGRSLTLTVNFAPTAAGSFTGTLAIQSNATNSTLSVALSGAAVAATPVIGFSSTSLTFASQTLGSSSAAQSITLTNTGTAALSISGIAASGDFSQTNLCGSSLAVNASCTISVTFTPTATGARSGAISFSDNAAASPQQVSLSGTGSAATLQAASSALAFGSITAGTSTLQTVVISNTGNASATIQTITTGNTAFTVSGATLPAAIAAGGSLTLTVNFAPTAAGSFTGTLAIQSNATNSTLSVALSGTAVAAAPISHSVTLTWSDSSGSISGYNVYRSAQSGSGYVILNSGLVATAAYVDTTVSGGQTYYYVVTAVSTAGVESAYSTCVTAVVPTT